MSSDKRTRVSATQPLSSLPILARLGHPKPPKPHPVDVSDDAYVDSVTLAKMLGTSRAFLDKRRIRGGGPPYVRFDVGVRYQIRAVKAWLAVFTARSSQQKEAA